MRVRLANLLRRWAARLDPPRYADSVSWEWATEDAGEWISAPAWHVEWERPFPHFQAFEVQPDEGRGAS